MIAALACLFRARFEEAGIDPWLAALKSQGRAYGPGRGPADADEATEVLLPDDAGRWPLWWSFDFGKDYGALPAVPGATTVDYLGWTGFRARPDEVAAVLRANVEARAEAFAIELAAVIEDLVHEEEVRAAMLPYLRPVVELWPGRPDFGPVDELWHRIEATPFRRFRLGGHGFRIPAGLSETDLSAWLAGARTLPRGKGGVDDSHTVIVEWPEGSPFALSYPALMWIWDAERAVRRDRSAVFVAGETLAALREMVAPVDAGPAFAAAVRDALSREANPLANAAADSADQVARWAVDLLKEARAFVGRLTAPTTESEARKLVDGMMPWDAAIIRRLEELDGDLASGLRKLRKLRAAKAEEPPRALWAFWNSPAEVSPRWLAWLAGGLFRSRWGPGLSREGQTVFHPAVAAAMIGSLRATKTGPATPDGERLPLLGSRGEELSRLLLDTHTGSLPSYTPERLRRVLGSMTAHRWLRFILPDLQSAWLREGRATTLTLEGGKAGIIGAMREAGLGGSRADGDVIADVIAACGRIEARTERTRGNLYGYEMPLTADDWKTRPGSRATVKLTPGPIMDPLRLFDDPNHRAIPLIRKLPPLQWADRGQHAGICTLAIILTRILHERRLELAREGGVLLGPKEWAEGLAEAGLRDPGPFLWTLTRDALVVDGRSDVAAGGEPVPAFLRVTEKGTGDRWRFTLATEHTGAKAWIDGAAARALKNSKRGKTRAKKRKT